MREAATLMAYWITEREAMRERKEHAPSYAPQGNWKYGYSDDPHMGTVRYCNVRREDDKVTRWLAAHWRPKYSQPWQIAMARMVNYIPTLERIVGMTPQQAAVEMKMLRNIGDKIWTSAYTISTCGQSMDKVDYVMSVVGMCKQHFKEPLITHLSDWHAALMRTNGLGSFLAAQVIADLKNTAGHPLQNAPDFYTWSAPGPGSLKGLSAYYEASITARLYQKHITTCWAEVQPLLPTNLQDLHMQDFQNCLCEFSKFIRVRKGGHARNKYSAG